MAITGSRKGGIGRDATSPIEIPEKGWKDVLKRVYKRFLDDGLSFDAAAVAFYFLLALVPAIAAVVAIYGLLMDQAKVVEHISLLSGMLPDDVLNLLATELKTIASSETTGWALAVSVGLAIWGSSKGISAITDALNRVYVENERRSFMRRKLNDLMLTAALIIFTVVILLLVVIAPAIMKFAGLEDSSSDLIGILRWPALFVTIILALTFLFRFAPCRTDAKWRWVAPGSVIATLLMVGALAGMTIYATHGGGSSTTYGSLGAVVLLMFCFYLSALSLLLGGVINAETEHQTARDSTVGSDKPLGSRGAHVADTVGTTQWKPDKNTRISAIS